METQIYILKAKKSGNAVYKIGITERKLQARLQEIKRNGDEQANAKVVLAAYLPRVWSLWLETNLHKRYNARRYMGFKGSGKSEWFAISYPVAAVLSVLVLRLFYTSLRILFWLWNALAVYLLIDKINN